MSNRTSSTQLPVSPPMPWRLAKAVKTVKAHQAKLAAQRSTTSKTKNVAIPQSVRARAEQNRRSTSATAPSVKTVSSTVNAENRIATKMPTPPAVPLSIQRIARSASKAAASQQTAARLPVPPPRLNRAPVAAVVRPSGPLKPPARPISPPARQQSSVVDIGSGGDWPSDDAWPADDAWPSNDDSLNADGWPAGDDWFPDDLQNDGGDSPDSGQLGFDGMRNMPRLALDNEQTNTVDISALDSLRGRVIKIQKYGEWGRGTLIPENGDSSITIVGNAVAMLSNGDSVILHGTHKVDPRYGNQFDVSVATPDATSTPALIAYLQKNFKGVGSVGAKRIVDHYQAAGDIETLRQSLIYKPSSLDFSSIVGRPTSLFDDNNSSSSRVNTLFSLQYSSLGLRSDVLRTISRVVLAHIEAMSPEDLLKTVNEIENRQATKAPSALPVEQKTVAKLIGTTLPTGTDEQMVAQLIAEYEGQYNIIKTGFVPTAPIPNFSSEKTSTVDAAIADETDEYEHLIEDHAQRSNYDDFMDEDKDKPLVDHIHACRVIFADNPYVWITRGEGLGFKTVDKIGAYEGIEATDPRRLGALSAYALRLACEAQSHTYIEEDYFRYAINQVDKQVNSVDAIQIALEGKYIDQEGDRYYPTGLLRKEKELAHDLASRITREIEPLLGNRFDYSRIDQLIDMAEDNVRERKNLDVFKLDDVQRQAVKGVLSSTSGLHVIVGGPGRGKTAIVQVIMESLKISNRRIESAFCAPVGKASKVLQNQIKDYGAASTMHSLLKAKGGGFDFEFNRTNQLQVNLVTADEQSMSGIGLAHGLMAAIKKDAHTILLGDPNQLQSIDSGDFLRSVLKLEGVDKYELIKPHRNRGQILGLIDTVNAGRWPTTAEEIKKVTADGDVTLHNSLSVLSSQNIPNFIDLVVKASNDYEGVEHIGVICPTRKGRLDEAGWNVTYLNEALRNRLNPDPDDTKRIVGSRFRINDRILITKNMKQVNYHAIDQLETSVLDVALCKADLEDDAYINVINGDTGYLESAIMGLVNETMQAVGFVLRLDDGNKVILDVESKDELAHSYAITVHAAQGSEYEKVFAIVPDGHSSFMHRHLLMTGLSRAKSSLEVFGETAICAKIASRLPPHRNCGIYERAEEWIMDFNAEVQQFAAVPGEALPRPGV